MEAISSGFAHDFKGKGRRTRLSVEYDSEVAVLKDLGRVSRYIGEALMKEIRSWQTVSH